MGLIRDDTNSVAQKKAQPSTLLAVALFEGPLEMTEQVHKPTLVGDRDIGNQQTKGSARMSSERVTGTSVLPHTSMVPPHPPTLGMVTIYYEFLQRLVDRYIELVKPKTRTNIQLAMLLSQIKPRVGTTINISEVQVVAEMMTTM